MHAELAVLSFLSVLFIFFLLILAYASFRNNSTLIVLAFWLVICNVVYGVDSIVWANKARTFIEPWCDIVTRVLLAANVAIPGATLGLALDLERLAAPRKLHNDTHTRRLRLIYDVTLCFLVPICYIALHLIVQDHRFDIVKDFGCVASIHPSDVSTVIMLIPAALMCAAALSFGGLAGYWLFRLPTVQRIEHLRNRSRLTVKAFQGRLVVVLLMSVVSLVTTSISISADDLSLPWVSWDVTHVDVDIVDVVQSSRGVQASWVGIFIVGVFFIGLVLAEYKKLGVVHEFFPRAVSMMSVRGRSQDILLPMMAPPMSRAELDAQSPEPIELVSGWDEMLHTKPGRKSPNKLQLTVEIPPSRPTADDVFAADTFQYLKSPQARTLGVISPALPSPPRRTPSPIRYTPPPPVNAPYPRPPPVNTLHLPAESAFPAVSIAPMPVGSVDATLFRRRPSVPDDVSSTISSLYDMPWPLPPQAAAARASRYSNIDGGEFPITRSLLDQRKTPRHVSIRTPTELEPPSLDEGIVGR